MSGNTLPFSITDLAIDYCPADPDKPTFVFVHGNTQNSSCGEGLIKFLLNAITVLFVMICPATAVQHPRQSITILMI